MNEESFNIFIKNNRFVYTRRLLQCFYLYVNQNGKKQPNTEAF